MNERDVFIAALQKESHAGRQEYLDEACAGDENLRRNVMALLATHDRAGDFLREPICVQVGALLAAPDGAAPSTEATDPARTEDFSARTLPPREKPTEAHADPGQPSLTFLAPPQNPDELGRLGPFRVLRLLGQGGMGMVFLADDPQLGRSGG